MFPLFLHWPPLPFPSRRPLCRSIILTLLLISGIHPNPGPSPPYDPNLHILQLNVNGLQNTRAELIDFLSQRLIKVACLQETKLSPRSKPLSFPGFAFIRRDRPVGGGGGLAILVHPP